MKGYACRGYVALTKNRSGVLYPVYGLGNLNSLFVQEVEANGIIGSFLEFWDIENFHFVPSQHNPVRRVGEDSIYGFLDSEAVLYEVSYSEFGRQVRSGNFSIFGNDFPLLTQLGLSRLADLSTTDVSNALIRYLNKTGLAESSIQKIDRAEFRASLERASWWTEISRAEYGDSHLAQQFAGEDIETVIRWLFENEIDDAWKRVLLVVLRKIIVDERIGDLLAKFLGDDPDFAEFGKIEKQIVGRALEISVVLGQDHIDIKELLIERVVDGTIFYLSGVVSCDTIAKYINLIVLEKSSGEGCAYVIDSLIDYLLCENLQRNLADSLMRIVLESDVLLAGYPSFSFYAGQSRLFRIWSGFNDHSRLYLALSEETKLKLESLAIQYAYVDDEADDQEIELYE